MIAGVSSPIETPDSMLRSTKKITIRPARPTAELCNAHRRALVKSLLVMYNHFSSLTIE